MNLFSFLASFSGITIFLGVVAFLVLLFIYHFILTPLIKLNFYKKQGIRTSFFPIFGILHFLKKSEAQTGDNWHCFKKQAQKEPELEIEALNIGAKPFVLFHSSRLLKSVYSDNSPYAKFKSMQPITLFTEWGFPALEGRIFKEHRKTVSQLFSFSFLGQKVSTMRENAKIVLEKMAQRENLKGFEIIESMFEYSGSNVGDLFFGGLLKKYTVDGKSIVNFTSEIQNESGLLTRTLPLVLFGRGILKYGLFASHRKFNAKIKKFRGEVAKIINDRKASIEESEVDLLKALLQTQSSTDPDVAYTDDMIIDEYITMFVAGSENPSHISTLALYLLASDPEYKKKIMEEISEIYDKEPLSTQSVQKMSYLHGLIQETLRLHTPSVSIQPRIALKDFNVDEYHIKKGTLLMPMFLHQHYNDIVFDDSFKFKPERWVDGSLSLEPFKYLPFSAGQRNCLGQHFAQLEIKVMICEFLKKFDYTISPGYKLHKTQRFLNVPLHDIPFDLVLRHE